MFPLHKQCPVWRMRLCQITVDLVLFMSQPQLRNDHSCCKMDVRPVIKRVMLEPWGQGGAVRQPCNGSAFPTRKFAVLPE